MTTSPIGRPTDVAELRLPPADHGGDGPRLAALLGVPPDDILDLSQSLNPVAPDPGPIIRRHLDTVGRYPDERPARRALADAIGVDPGLVVLTNGGSEAISLVGRVRPVGWVSEPEFSLYREALSRLDPAAGRWRSNPHSPTGLLASDSVSAAVWDEAFFSLATGRWTRGDHSRGSIVVGSLTKLFACPGLRAGYVIAPDDVTAETIRRYQPEWSVSTIAAEAIPDLLDSADLAGWARSVAKLRGELVDLFRAHDRVVRDTDANWVLVHDPDLRAMFLPHRIATRDCSSFGLDGVVRVAVPDAAGLERLAAALRAIG